MLAESATSSGISPPLLGVSGRAANSRIFGSAALAKFDAHEACFCNLCVLNRIREVADTVRGTARPKVLLFIGTQLTISAFDIGPADVMSRTAAELQCAVE